CAHHRGVDSPRRSALVRARPGHARGHPDPRHQTLSVQRACREIETRMVGRSRKTEAGTDPHVDWITCTNSLKKDSNCDYTNIKPDFTTGARTWPRITLRTSPLGEVQLPRCDHYGRRVVLANGQLFGSGHTVEVDDDDRFTGSRSPARALQHESTTEECGCEFRASCRGHATQSAKGGHGRGSLDPTGRAVPYRSADQCGSRPGQTHHRCGRGGAGESGKHGVVSFDRE